MQRNLTCKRIQNAQNDSERVTQSHFAFNGWVWSGRNYRPSVGFLEGIVTLTGLVIEDGPAVALVDAQHIL